MEKKLFLQQLIQRVHEEIFQRMSPEARARKLSVMRALAKTMRARNKQNENPVNKSVVPLPLSFKQSTPLKAPQITDLDEIDSDSDSEIPFEKEILDTIEQNSSSEGSTKGEEEDQILLITKIDELVPEDESIEFETVSKSVQNELEDSSDTVAKDYEDKSKHWRSLEALHENAEYEFCRSLEESKLCVSSASLLEEIEADLPSPYSLAKPFNYTFHTVSSYRTQARLARMVRFGLPFNQEKDMNSTCPDYFIKEDEIKTRCSSHRIDYLQKQAIIQKELVDQAEKALNLSKNKNFMGVHHLESEKALLLAKQYICIAKEKENVLSSSIITGEEDGKLHFKDGFKFDDLGKDFVILLELYKLHFKEPKTAILKTALVKKLKRMTPVNANRSIMCSSYGKGNFVREISAELRLEHLTTRESDKCVLLNRMPENLAGTSVTALVTTDIKVNFKLGGFLNVFRQTWHRRWYSLSGYFLESWLYPEDREYNKAPVDRIYLLNCISVTPVGIEVCIRPHCFAISLRSPEEKILFSADSNTNMDQWVNNLNLIMASISAWRPNI